MKIIFVSDAIYPYNKGGKEKRLFELSTRLAAMGHEVHIYTMHWWDSPERSRLEHGVHLHALCKKYEMYQGDRRSIKEGIFFGLACFKLLGVQGDIFDVDHMPFFPIFSSWLACKLRGKKMYGTWHEALTPQEWISYMGKPGIIASLIEKASTKLPDHITVSSPHTQRLLAQYHNRSHNLSVVTPGISLREFATIKPAPVTCDVLYVGRLVKDKNIDKLLQALQILAKKKPTIRCTIIGRGVEKAQLQELSKELGLEKVITFLDPLPEATDVYAYMKGAKVFCSPSVREGFGMVVLEALACNTPVVTVDSPANAAKHLITNAKIGSVVPLTPQALADALQHWVTQADKLEITQEIAEYDWDVLARKQLAAYVEK